MKQAALSYFQYPEMVLVPLILFFLFLYKKKTTENKNKHQFTKIHVLTPLHDKNVTHISGINKNSIPSTIFRKFYLIKNGNAKYVGLIIDVCFVSYMING